jgi:hypothetical protein
MSNVFDDIFGGGPDVPVVESPNEGETEAEIIDQKKKERDALGAFFSTLRQGGAEELRSPTNTGLRL